MSENELKSCPNNCGGNQTDILVDILTESERWKIGTIRCVRCGEIVPFRSDALSVDDFAAEAYGAWNTRHLPPEVEAVLEAGQAVSERKWISVKDRLPERNVKVIFVCRRHNEICVGNRCPYDGEQWYDDLQTDCVGDASAEYDITHWQPLPASPKEIEP